MRNLRYNQYMDSILQTAEWEEFRKTQGWQSFRVDEILILKRRLPLGKNFLYSPEIELEKIENFDEFLQKISKNCKDNKTIFLRLDFLTEFNENFVEKLKNSEMVKSFEEVQPEWRQIIDISGSEEDILTQMKPKGRYNIKVAQRHGAAAEKADSSANIDDFYEIFRQTAKRDGFQIRPKQYFAKMLEILKPAGLAELFIIRYNNKPVAAAIVSFYADTASYLYGASANEARQVMAPYWLHWQIIREAKKRGCRYYDLLAIAPEGFENHKYSGITRFKEQFGGRKIHLLGAWDKIYQPNWYKLFRIAEKYRRK